MIKWNLISKKTSSGKEYYTVYFRIKTADNKVKAINKSTGILVKKGNKRLAEQKAQEIVSQYEDISYCDFFDMTLDKYMLDYLERLKPDLKATTYDNYVSMYKRHIQPYFSTLNLPLKQIKPMHITAYINAKMDEVSANTVIKQFRLISQCMQDAVINDIIKANPCHKVKPPKKSKPQHDWYNEQELKTLLNIAKDTVLEVPIFLAVMFGLRRSEIIGLKWSAIDWNKRTLTICGSVTRAKQPDGTIKDVYSDSLKTEASNSTYILDDISYEYLHNLYENNMQIISNVDDYKEYVCVNAIGERLKLDYITHKFSKLLKANGLRQIRFHDLRHSALSLLSNSFSMKAVQSYARHSEYNITANTYCHTDNQEMLKETSAICNVLEIDKFCKNTMQEQKIG